MIKTTSSFFCSFVSFEFQHKSFLHILSSTETTLLIFLFPIFQPIILIIMLLRNDRKETNKQKNKHGKKQIKTNLSDKMKQCVVPTILSSRGTYNVDKQPSICQVLLVSFDQLLEVFRWLKMITNNNYISNKNKIKTKLTFFTTWAN